MIRRKRCVVLKIESFTRLSVLITPLGLPDEGRKGISKEEKSPVFADFTKILGNAVTSHPVRLHSDDI